MRLPVILFLIFFTAHIRAQNIPVIVKDYNNCTVGLQDNSGSWITPPIYSQIWPFSWTGRAVMLRNGKYGVIDTKGNEVIPATYDQVAQMRIAQGSYSDRLQYNDNYTRYLCHDGHRTDIRDTAGKVLLSVPYDLSNFSDSVSIGQDSLGFFHLVHLNGKVFSLPQKIKIPPTLIYPGIYVFTVDTSYDAVMNKKKRVFRDKRLGAINKEGKILVPAAYYDVVVCNNPYAVIRAIYGTCADYYSLAGKPLLHCEKVPDFYSSHKENPFAWSGRHSITDGKKYGVINYRGDTILPVLYDAEPMWVSSNCYRVVMDGKQGIVTDSGKIILPPKYDFVEIKSLGYYGAGPYNNFLVRDSSGWNIIDTNGIAVFTESQDTVIHAGYSMLFIKGKQVTSVRSDYSDGAVGMTEKMFKGWFSGPDSVNPYYPRYNGEDYWVLDHPSSNKNDTVVTYNNRWSAWFDYLDCMQSLEAETTPIQKRGKRKSKPYVNPYPYLFIQDSRSYWTAQAFDTVHSADNYVSYYSIAPPCYSRELHERCLAVVRTDHDTFAEYFSSIYWVASFTVFGNGTWQGMLNSRGEVIIFPGQYKEFHFIDNEKTILYAKDYNNNSMLVDTAGNLMCQANNASIQQFRPGIVWIVTMDTSAGNPGYPCYYSYQLYDYVKRIFLIDTTLHIYDAVRNYSSPRELKTTTGTGMIDPVTVRILVEPKYARVQRMDNVSKYFLITSCYGLLGVIDTSGNIVVDTTYQGVIKIHGAGSVNKDEDNPLTMTGDDVFLFYNAMNKEKLLFYGDARVTKIDPTQYGTVLKLLQDEQLRKSSYSSNRCRVCLPSLETKSGVTLNAWQDSLLFHSIFGKTTTYSSFGTYGTGHYNECGCHVYNPYSYNYGGYNYYALQPVIVHFASDSFISYVHTSQQADEGSYEWRMKSFSCRNVIKDAHGTHPITLDSLFTGTVWQQIIIDSVLSYLENHPGISANCNKPELYPKILNEKFLIQKDGLALYPDWYSKTDGQHLPQRPVVLIPWNVLDPHLRPSMRTVIAR